jgi:hypothetical protein
MPSTITISHHRPYEILVMQSFFVFAIAFSFADGVITVDYSTLSE